MRLLHSSDWHLGQSFVGESREEEHRFFLKWLTSTIRDKKIELLIVSGDIFDTTNPPNYALELYYNFLSEIQEIETLKKSIFILGNHDSANSLKTSKNILKRLNIEVITGVVDELPILDIKDAIVVAVPFIRYGDIVDKRDINGIDIRYKDALTKIYSEYFEKAKELKGDRDIPIIATGHLTTFGSKRSDSEREIYVGGEIEIKSDVFELFDYVALGHLHRNQRVGGSEKIRYSGSPIHLSFSERGVKSVNIVEFSGSKIANLSQLEIPKFRELFRVKGKSLDEVIEMLSLIKESNLKPFIEITLEDNSLSSIVVDSRVKEVVGDRAKILKVNLVNSLDNSSSEIENLNISLEDINEIDIFKQKLDSEKIDEELKEELIKRFKEILEEVRSEDIKD
jgi:exonuclease SbcD